MKISDSFSKLLKCVTLTLRFKKDFSFALHESTKRKLVTLILGSIFFSCFLTIITTQATAFLDDRFYPEETTDKIVRSPVERSNRDIPLANNDNLTRNDIEHNTKSKNPQVSSDFNGDGFEDKAVGSPWEDYGTEATKNFGKVHIIYGSSNGLNATLPLPDQLLIQGTSGIQGTPEFGDFFGSSLSTADYNADGYSDLAIGVPGEGIDLATLSSNEFDVSINSNLQIFDCGVVQVIYGSSTGLNASGPIHAQFFLQGFSGLDDMTENSDFFGGAISSGDYNGDMIDDLSIGVYGEDDSKENMGQVQVIYGSQDGLNKNASLQDQLLTREFIITDIQKDDHFGAYLSSGDYNADNIDDLSIGVPNEDRKLTNGTILKNTGAVYVIFGSSKGLKVTLNLWDQFWTQANLGGVPMEDDNFGSALSSGDYNGDTFDDLSIGVIGEGFGGVVQVIYGSSTGLNTSNTFPPLLWTQNATNVNPLSIAALSLSTGDYNGDRVEDLAIGAYRREVGNVLFAGRVHILYGSSIGLGNSSNLPAQLWTQDSENLKDYTEYGDFFGASLSSGDFNGDGVEDLVVGVPQEDIGVTILRYHRDVGVVHVIYGSLDGLNATEILPNQRWWTGSKDIEGTPAIEDRFGIVS